MSSSGCVEYRCVHHISEVKFCSVFQSFDRMERSLGLLAMKLNLLSLAMLAILTNAPAVEAAEPFKSSCRVTDNIVLDVEEGRPRHYKGFSEGVEIGDQFQIVIHGGRIPTTTSGRAGYEILGIKLEGLGDLSFNLAARHLLGATSNRVRFTNKPIDQLSELGLVNKVLLTLSPNHFESSQLIRGRVKALTFERYYKNDWAGFLTITTTKSYLSYVQVLSFDCRGFNDNLDELLSELNSPE